jgi:hypothetical protein
VKASSSSGTLEEGHRRELRDLFNKKALIDEQILAQEERHREKMGDLWSRRDDAKEECWAAVARMRQLLGLSEGHLFDPVLVDFVPPSERKG